MKNTTVSAEKIQKQLNEINYKKQLDYEKLREKRKSIFNDFYQINKLNSEYLRRCLNEQPRALELLLFIYEKMDKYNALVCSYDVFMTALNVSKATLARSIKYLKLNGYIYVYKSGTSNVYVANPDLVWNSWGYNVQYCEFPANVILSSSEQDNLINNNKKLNHKYKKILTLEDKK